MEPRPVRFSGKRVLIALAGIFAVVLALGLRYYGHYHPFADLVGAAGPHGLTQTSLQITDAVVTGRTDGRLRWRVRAHSLTLSRDRREVTVRGIHDGVLYTDRGQPQFSLRAGQAVYEKPFSTDLFDAASAHGGLLSVTGGILGRSLQPGGPTLYGDTLVWDAARDEVRSLGRTTALFPKGTTAIGGLKMEASVLIWSTTQETLRAPGIVTATFATEGGRVQGENILVDTKHGTLSAAHLHGTFRTAGT